MLLRRGWEDDGAYQTIAANLSGVVWAFLLLWAWHQFGEGVPLLSALVGLAAFFMVLQAKVPALSFIPGAFIGAAAAVSVVVGAGTTFPHPWVKTIIALVAGAILGYVSEMLAGSIGGRKRASV